ncbi:nitrate reductase molybdenum cofactor assembly chaperone [Arthrobacter crystallopoietes]|uniref:nitrate reductase molybdenum cofactor assembly chaperone n=1 Tax=Crystallibacter crystallopoietes TaxID=37928 RepID=UPI001ABEAA57|nr:nitrate reductase molybdenum cofactor assembly chaperone [Arthrobacter crystallopoietes]QTG81788.1 nitrate reductase molybdenum cofactor assembly chaperone [Arthrobacter crystallopoietes]
MMQRQRVTYLAASWCLGYPDEELLERMPLIRSALAEFNGLDRSFGDVLNALTAKPLAEVQAWYVQEFDLSKRHALHLSYWTDGDTRRRGEVLIGFKQVYRDSGMLVNTHGELPDYLPMVLEFAAMVDLAAGRELLTRYRPSLEMLRLALVDDSLPHAQVLQAICDTLPGASPTDRQQVMKMAGYGPPTESVGLEPYDPRLLPMQGGQ